MKIGILTVALFVTACGAQATPVPATRGAVAPPATAGAASEFTDAAGNRILGKADAPVTITDYSDFL